MTCPCGNEQRGMLMNPRQPKAGKDDSVLLYMAGMDAKTNLCWICSNPRDYSFVLGLINDRS